MENSLLSFAMIIISTSLVATIVLQSKGAGLGGWAGGGGGGDAGGTFSARRGLEKTLFRITIVLSFLFFALAIYTVLQTG
ncbi:MAG TPA: preprotein translocase subunit SecG [Anaerolineales bacterium]|nr:preprotein translocase subunit SecG [Anaerolineales bacterium]